VSNLLKKEKGFTLIEIVLVLAIAGLLLVIVFLAVSGAQKSRRDSQRKNDNARLLAQVEAYASNNNGVYPANLTAATFTTYVPSNFNDPTTGSAYALNGTTTTPASGTVTYRLGTACDGTTPGSRVVSVIMGLEQGAQCLDNK
jgi:prepilin-type N-terminal cleavage/methylation domain-containing protein